MILFLSNIITTLICSLIFGFASALASTLRHWCQRRLNIGSSIMEPFCDTIEHYIDPFKGTIGCHDDGKSDFVSACTHNLLIASY